MPPRVKTTEGFVMRARQVHGDKYDYTNSVYVSSHQPLEIKCNVCGYIFNQSPTSHTSGAGCRECAKAKISLSQKGKLQTTKEEFVERARAVHGDKYNYDDSVYTGSASKLDIFCNACQTTFTQAAHHHLEGCGCRACGLKVAISKFKPSVPNTQEQFLEKAHTLHGDKYDYSMSNYQKSNIKINIRCKVHDTVFSQTPASHFAGRGCPTCGQKKRNDSTRKSLSTFLEEAQKAHPEGAFDYAMVTEYVAAHTKVCIKCNTCQTIFYQEANSHVQGFGCKQCRSDKISLAKTLPVENFLEKAKKIHGDKYDYSLITYSNRKQKVAIICNICGNTFEQKPQVHINGYSGCSVCILKTQNKVFEYIQSCVSFPVLFEASLSLLHITYKNDKRKRYDIAIRVSPTYYVIVEVDGLQHLEPIPFFKSDPVKQRALDAVKMDLATSKGYAVIRIMQPNIVANAYDWQAWLKSSIDMCVRQHFSGVIVSPYDAPMYEEHRKVYEAQCASWQSMEHTSLSGS